MIFCGLRAPITGLGSLVSTIRDGLGLSSTSAGMLTTIPLIAFGIIYVSVGHFSDRLGAGKVMLVGLLLLVAGIVLRTFAVAAGLFIGTAIIGIGLAVGNVLIPAFIKAFFPEKVGTMTSAYTTSMSVFAGISGGISVPLAKAYGWQLSLFIWIIPAATALLLWLPNRNTVLAVKAKRASKGGSIAKDSMTWLISLYMGVQSLLFYCFVAWFATFLQSRRFDFSVSGYYNSIYMLLGIPGSLVVPILAEKSKKSIKVGRWPGHYLYHRTCYHVTVRWSAGFDYRNYLLRFLLRCVYQFFYGALWPPHEKRGRYFGVVRSGTVCWVFACCDWAYCVRENLRCLS